MHLYDYPFLLVSVHNKWRNTALSFLVSEVGHFQELNNIFEVTGKFEYGLIPKNFNKYC